MSRPTQAQIAERANVDRSTVSKILNGYQIEHFVPETIEKIKKAVLELGYRHRGHCWEIWCIFPFPESEKIYSDSYRLLEAIVGINNALKGINGSFHLIKYDENFRFISNQADGYLIWEAISPRYQNDLNRLGLPYIVLNRVPPGYQGSYVIHADTVDFCLAAEYLSTAGHQNIALISDQSIAGADEYLAAIASLLNHRNIPFSEENFFYLTNSSWQDMIEFLNRKKITAIIASNDIVGQKAIELIQLAGKRIPEDYSIIVNNYIELNTFSALKLTGIKTPWQKIAFRGTELLLSRISQKNNSTKPVHEVIDPILTEGNSVRFL